MIDLSMLSVVIPVYNEAPNVAPLLAELAAIQANLPELTEIIMVDDHSIDDTLAQLQSAKTQYPWLKILRLSERSGKSTAQWHGIRAAKNELILTMDGDLQNDPADIPGMLRAYQQAAHQPVFVIGQRTQRHDDWLRCASSKTANRVRQCLLKDNVRDSGCCVRLCRRDDYLSLPFFDNMHRFIPALALQSGFSLVLVDINHRPRIAGVAKYGFWNRLCPGIVDMFGLLWLGRRRRTQSHVTHY